jgi:hypothetical protein
VRESGWWAATTRSSRASWSITGHAVEVSGDANRAALLRVESNHPRWSKAGLSCGAWWFAAAQRLQHLPRIRRHLNSQERHTLKPANHSMTETAERVANGDLTRSDALTLCAHRHVVA